MIKHILPVVLLISLPARADEPLPPGAAAVVNGEAVPLAELQQLLLRRHGAGALQELILKRLIDQEAGRTGVEVAEAEIKARYEVAQAELRKQAAAEITLAQALQSQGISEAEFREQVVTRLTLEKLAVLDGLCAAWARLSLLVAADEEKAQALQARLKAGEDFAALARKESMHASAARGGDLGPCFRGELPPELEPAAFSLPAGSVTGIVRTPLGFVIARVEERQEANPRGYAALRKEVDGKLAQEPPGEEMLSRFIGRLKRGAKIQAMPLAPAAAP